MILDFSHFNFYYYRFGMGYTMIIRSKTSCVETVQDFVAANFNNAKLKVYACLWHLMSVFTNGTLNTSTQFPV